MGMTDMDMHAERVLRDGSNDMRRVLAKRGDLPLPRQRTAFEAVPDFAELVDLVALRSAGAVSVIVPTRNEAATSAAAEPSRHALSGLDARVIFVDDSDDDTADGDRCARHREHGARAPASTEPQPTAPGGLGGAVVARAARAHGAVGRRHGRRPAAPAGAAAAAVEMAEQRDVDLVVASRLRRRRQRPTGLATAPGRRSPVARRASPRLLFPRRLADHATR